MTAGFFEARVYRARRLSGDAIDLNAGAARAFSRIIMGESDGKSLMMRCVCPGLP